MMTHFGKEVTGNFLELREENLLGVLLENRGQNLDFIEERSLNELHNPLLLPDIVPAIRRIRHALEQNERIIVFGDYDVDGISGTTILGRCLKQLGGNVSFRLPHRVDDGYGFRSHFLEKLKAADVKLVITVDCGTKDIETIKMAYSLGIDCIVTDHHCVPEIIPKEAIAIINPKRKDSVYPFSGLSGSGVAFQLARALFMEFLTESEAKKSIENLVDFASLGTIADMVPLIDENRIIVLHGLRKLGESSSPGLKKLSQLHQKHHRDTDVVGFHIGPRINASGRIDTPLHAFRMLYNQESNSLEYLDILESLNTTRKELTKKFSRDAIEKHDPNSIVAVYINNEISHGVLGLIAGKLTQTFSKISFVGVQEGDEIVASIRAPVGMDIMNVFYDLESYFLRFGGHAQAAGCTIHKENLPNLLEALNQKLDGFEIQLPEQKIDGILPFSLMTHETYERIQTLQPFGIGFHRPLFLTETGEIENIKFFGKEQEHVEIQLKNSPIPLKGFFLSQYFVEGKQKKYIRCIGTLESQTFLGKRKLDFFLQDFISE